MPTYDEARELVNKIIIAVHEGREDDALEVIRDVWADGDSHGYYGGWSDNDDCNA